MTATLGYVGDWQVQQWMNDIVAGKSMASLHRTDPGPVQENASATEPQGGSYLRQPITWSDPGDSVRLLRSANVVEWVGLPETVVTHLGIWNSVYGGQMRAVIPLLTPLYVVANGSYKIAKGELYLRWP